jgi:hypothetical protein
VPLQLAKTPEPRGLQKAAQLRDLVLAKPEAVAHGEPGVLLVGALVADGQELLGEHAHVHIRRDEVLSLASRGSGINSMRAQACTGARLGCLTPCSESASPAASRRTEGLTICSRPAAKTRACTQERGRLGRLLQGCRLRIERRDLGVLLGEDTVQQAQGASRDVHHGTVRWVGGRPGEPVPESLAECQGQCRKTTQTPCRLRPLAALADPGEASSHWQALARTVLTPNNSPGELPSEDSVGDQPAPLAALPQSRLHTSDQPACERLPPRRKAWRPRPTARPTAGPRTPPRGNL